MAKDVDLSSKEWRDIVFEGKNKDFGAYEMRKKSDGRHNKAMIIVLIAVVIIFFALRLVNLALEQAAANIVDEASQEIVQVDMGEQEEPEEEEEMVQIEEEKQYLLDLEQKMRGIFDSYIAKASVELSLIRGEVRELFALSPRICVMWQS